MWKKSDCVIIFCFSFWPCSQSSKSDWTCLSSTRTRVLVFIWTHGYIWWSSFESEELFCSVIWWWGLQKDCSNKKWSHQMFFKPVAELFPFDIPAKTRAFCCITGKQSILMFGFGFLSWRSKYNFFWCPSTCAQKLQQLYWFVCLEAWLLFYWFRCWRSRATMM